MANPWEIITNTPMNRETKEQVFEAMLQELLDWASSERETGREEWEHFTSSKKRE